jgi:hypothetical protein
MNVVVSLDPNIKFDPTNPTPAWNHWSSDDTEMLFNKTSTNEPDIKAVRTDTGLLERCAYVLLYLRPILYVILRLPVAGFGIVLRTLLVSKYRFDCFSRLQIHKCCIFKWITGPGVQN